MSHVDTSRRIAKKKPAAPIYCSQCGTQNAAGSNFCWKCGEPLVTVSPVKSPRPAEPRPAITSGRYDKPRAKPQSSGEEINFTVPAIAKSPVPALTKPTQPIQPTPPTPPSHLPSLDSVMGAAMRAFDEGQDKWFVPDLPATESVKNKQSAATTWVDEEESTPEIIVKRRPSKSFAQQRDEVERQIKMDSLPYKVLREPPPRQAKKAKKTRNIPRAPMYFPGVLYFLRHTTKRTRIIVVLSVSIILLSYWAITPENNNSTERDAKASATTLLLSSTSTPATLPPSTVAALLPTAPTTAPVATSAPVRTSAPVVANSGQTIKLPNAHIGFVNPSPGTSPTVDTRYNGTCNQVNIRTPQGRAVNIVFGCYTADVAKSGLEVSDVQLQLLYVAWQKFRLGESPPQKLVSEHPPTTGIGRNPKGLRVYDGYYTASTNGSVLRHELLLIPTPQGGVANLEIILDASDTESAISIGEIFDTLFTL